MSTAQKLTKKQKKGVAFRERKSGKRNGKDELSMEANALPAMEDQDLAGGDGHPDQGAGDHDTAKGKAVDHAGGGAGERAVGKVGGKGKGKAKAEDVPVAVAEVGKKGAQKRKRGEEDDGALEESAGAGADKSASKKSAKRKKTDGKDASKTDDKKAKPSKQRFLLFLGNLKYTTPLSAIQAHFAVCDPPPTIRLLTPKSIGGGPAQKLKSKGCAFLEFTHRNALQQGLKLHQTMLDGRMINVELTAGGGGKSDARLTKVRERNKALLEEREERIEKEATQDGAFPNLPSRPQRFSATSGLDHAPPAKKTWTVGDADDGETHRGGERHRKKAKSKGPSKTWGTGVNAIPVG